jgi:hypothetical protein
MSDPVSYNLKPGKLGIIRAIADRATTLDDGLRKVDVVMDLTACHANGCPLDLTGLLNTGPARFGHDIYGIMWHLDRETGELRNGFVPLYALKS